MALADFTPERVEIKHNGSVVCSVRGLGTDDISVLVRAHLDTMNKLFEIAGARTILAASISLRKW
jgi:hypothetical protein